METSPKAYVVGTLSIDDEGIWHVSYVGPQRVGFRTYFGEGVESDRNIRTLLNVVGARLNRAKEVYTEKIKEVELKAEKNSGELDHGTPSEPTTPSESTSL